LNRRQLLLSASAAAIALPRIDRAQREPLIGFLSSQSSDAFAPFATAFREGLADSGLVEGTATAR
jgi:putative ABC transport system substrate-binding protein